MVMLCCEQQLFLPLSFHLEVVDIVFYFLCCFKYFLRSPVFANTSQLNIELQTALKQMAKKQYTLTSASIFSEFEIPYPIKI